VGLANALSDGDLVVYYPYLLVDPEYQRLGVGSELMRMLRERYGGLYQQVLISVQDAIPFYQRQGFALSRASAMEIQNLDV
jgi:ribosomal protein S18 acetylase RimI-like enzyme